MKYLATLITLLVATAANAEELRDLCPDRPGIGTPPCVVDKGHVMVETGLVDWIRERDAESKTDTFLFGDTLVRVGLGATTEAQVEWAPLGHVRERDRATGAVDRATRAGDVTLAIRQNLASPDGSKASLSLQPFVTLPIGREPVGAGDWGAGLIVPASYELNKTIKLYASPRAYAEVDEDGDGRHLAYGSVVGFDAELGKLTTTVELSGMRDDDPSGHETEALAGLSFGYQPSKSMQFDAGTNLGLNRRSPDVELYVGVSRRF